MEKEIWRDIEGYNGLYQVSNMGRVKSLNYDRTGKEKILKQYKDKDGYLYINLCKNSKKKTLKVHRLVALAFIDNPDGKEEIDHINTIRDDNRLENLSWATRKENNNNPITRSKHAEHTRKVLQFTKEGVFVREWDCIMEVQRELGFDQGNISRCCSGKYKTSYGYKWKHAEELDK